MTILATSNNLVSSAFLIQARAQGLLGFQIQNGGSVFFDPRSKLQKPWAELSKQG